MLHGIQGFARIVLWGVFSYTGEGAAVEFRIGDAVFNHAGQPGIVADKRIETGEIVVKPQADTLKQVQKRGYINGLTPEQRRDFEEVMEKIGELENPEKKVEALNTQIDQLRMGDGKARVVAKYLDSEKQHLMATNHIENKLYVLDPFRMSD